MRARRKPMKKRSIHLEYVSILKRLATQLSGFRRVFEMASKDSRGIYIPFAAGIFLLSAVPRKSSSADHSGIDLDFT